VQTVYAYQSLVDELQKGRPVLSHNDDHCPEVTQEKHIQITDAVIRIVAISHSVCHAILHGITVCVCVCVHARLCMRVFWCMLLHHDTSSPCLLLPIPMNGRPLEGFEILVNRRDVNVGVTGQQ
jgi:hypothetical protein